MSDKALWFLILVLLSYVTPYGEHCTRSIFFSRCRSIRLMSLELVGRHPFHTKCEVYCDGPDEPLLAEPERLRAADPSLWQLARIPSEVERTSRRCVFVF